MLLDQQLVMSDKQNLAQIVATYLCDKSIDLLLAGTDAFGNTPIHDRGRGNTPELIVEVTTTFTSGGAGTLQVQAIYADDAALTTNVVVMESTDVLAKAALVQGYQFRLGTKLPLGFPGTATGRYFGVQYVIGTATMTAGKVSAWLQAGGRQSNANSI